MKPKYIKLETSNVTGTARCDEQTQKRLNEGTGTKKISSIAGMTNDELIAEGIRPDYIEPVEEGLYQKTAEEKKQLKEIKKNNLDKFRYNLKPQ